MLTVILSGGGSRRMGRDKANLPFGETSMLLTLISRYIKSLGEVAVSVDKSGRFELGDALELVDSFPGRGPLNGLYSAFTQTKEEQVFLTATDIPCGDPLLALTLQSGLGGHDACVIKRFNGTYEPLFAVYRRSCLNAVDECLRGEIRSFPDLFTRLDVKFLPESELKEWSLDEILENVNTPSDYELLIKRLRKTTQCSKDKQ